MNHEEIEAAIERLQTSACDTVASVIINLIGSKEWYYSDDWCAKDLRDTLVDLLRQADPDTHMELPKDANGEHIHIGDELISNHSKKKFIVTRLNYSRKHAWMVGGADKDDLSRYSLYAPCETRHYQPTVEDVLREYASIVIGVGDRPELEGVIDECAARLREVMADE